MGWGHQDVSSSWSCSGFLAVEMVVEHFPAAAPSWASHIPVTLQCFLMAAQHGEPITAGESKQLNKMQWKLKIRGKPSLEISRKMLASTWSKFLQPGERFKWAGCGCVLPSWGFFLLAGKACGAVGQAQVRDAVGLCPGAVPSWGARGGREHSGCSSRSLLAFKACE